MPCFFVSSLNFLGRRMSNSKSCVTKQNARWLVSFFSLIRCPPLSLFSPLPDSLSKWNFPFLKGFCFPCGLRELIGDARRKRLGWRCLHLYASFSLNFHTRAFRTWKIIYVLYINSKQSDCTDKKSLYLFLFLFSLIKKSYWRAQRLHKKFERGRYQGKKK